MTQSNTKGNGQHTSRKGIPGNAMQSEGLRAHHNLRTDDRGPPKTQGRTGNRHASPLMILTTTPPRYENMHANNEDQYFYNAATNSYNAGLSKQLARRLQGTANPYCKWLQTHWPLSRLRKSSPATSFQAFAAHTTDTLRTPTPSPHPDLALDELRITTHASTQAAPDRSTDDISFYSVPDRTRAAQTPVRSSTSIHTPTPSVTRPTTPTRARATPATVPAPTPT